MNINILQIILIIIKEPIKYIKFILYLLYTWFYQTNNKSITYDNKYDDL